MGLPARPPVLRPYQSHCLDAVRDAYRRGIRRQLVCLPTGTGKTVVFSQLPRFFKMKHRMLVLAHREELLEQARDKMTRANPELRVDVEQGARRARADANVVIASVPTLGRERSSRLLSLPRDEFFLFVVDEAHHAINATYRRILEHFGVFEPNTKRLLVGFTATPKRGDGQGLDRVFQEIVFSRDLPEMVKAGFLAPLAGWRVETDVDLSSVKTRMGDYVVSQLSEAVNVDRRNAVVVKAHAELLEDRPTICFCADVAHAESLGKAFRAANVPAAAVSGAMDRAERAAILARFRAGELRVLTNCMLLTEGYDEPSVAGIILARPTKSELLYAQMIGRGTRLHRGKENVTVVDIVDASREHKLVALPTLFGLPGAFDLQGRTTTDAFEAFRWTAENRPWVPAELATSFSDLRLRCQKIELVDLETPVEISRVTRFAWVKAGDDAFRLNLNAGARLVVMRTLLGEWEAVLQTRAAPRCTICKQRELACCLQAAEAFVGERHSDLVNLIDRHSRWRKLPASDKQKEVLRRRGIAIPSNLKKGEASHLIGMILTG
jgi:superfamily II DNA or RNA helicase